MQEFNDHGRRFRACGNDPIRMNDWVSQDL